MIFNTTYKNNNYEKECNILTGSKFTFLESIKKGGIGSGRLIIKKASSKITSNHLKFSETDYANIELRPKGVIIHYTQKQERFSWIIPYYRLVIYNAQYFSIHANGSFIQFLKNTNYNENKKFINRMITLKNETLNLKYYDY